MKIKFFVLSALISLTFGSAQADAPVQANTWALQGVTFYNGGTTSGIFSVDSSANLHFYEINTFAADGSNQGYYTSANGSDGFSNPTMMFM